MSFQQIIELAGYTHRVSQMINVFEDVNKGNFVKVGKSKEASPSSNFGVLEWDSTGEPERLVYGQVVDLQSMSKVPATKTDGDIMLENVSIITPSGDVVVPDLSLKVIMLASS